MDSTYARQLVLTTRYRETNNNKDKINFAFQICVHPDVKNYIRELIQSLNSIIDSSKVERIVLVILDCKGEVVERFVFEIISLQYDSDRYSHHRLSKMIVKRLRSNPLYCCHIYLSFVFRDARYMLRLEHTLRAFILKLNTCDAELEPRPKGKEIGHEASYHHRRVTR